MSDQETLAQLERLQHLTQELIAQCDTRLAQVTTIASDLEPILAAHSAFASLGDLDSKLAQLENLGSFDTSAITAVLADAAHQTEALQAALTGASQWQVDLIAQKSELEALAATVATQAELVANAAAEVKDNLAASDQVSQSILERLDRLNTLALSETTSETIASTTDAGVSAPLPADLEQRLVALETALPTTSDWLNQIEASVQELQAFSEGLSSQQNALEALIAEGTAHLNGLLLRGQTQIADVVGSQQEHLSALITEASQRGEQAQGAVGQLEQQLPALRTATSQAEAVLAQLTPLGETIATQLAELTRLSRFEVPSLPDTTALEHLVQQLGQARESLAEQQAQMQQVAQDASLAIASLKDSTEADLSQRLFALSEAAITNVREALESLVLPGAGATTETVEAAALLAQVTEVQERLFEQQQSFASQLEASVQVQTGLEAQMQQWQSLIENVDLNGLALRLEQLEQTAAALNTAPTSLEPTHLDGVTTRLESLESQTEMVSTLQLTMANLCDQTVALESQLQTLQAAQATEELESIKTALNSLGERYTHLEQTVALQIAAETDTDLDALEAAYRLLQEKVTALEAKPVATAPITETVPLADFQALQAAHQELRDRYETLQSSQNTLIEATKALLKRVKVLES